MKVVQKLAMPLLMAFIANVGNAAAPEWHMDPAASSLSFSATQNNAPVTGEFKHFTATIFADPIDYKSSNIQIVVDIGSLSASYADLVTTLNTSDWFDSKLFPKAEFKATEFNKTGDQYQAIGILTIKGKSAPVTLNFTAKEQSKDKMLVEGSTLIKRSTFGVGQGEWASTDEIKDEVTVNFKITATK